MNTGKNILYNQAFIEAFRDYRLLLNKKYPQKNILKLIGDRYLLTGIQRSVLYRGTSTQEAAETRIKKLAIPDQLKTKQVMIDGYNVLMTIGSYLNGNPVFIATDGLLRDATELHGKIHRSRLVYKALTLIIEYFKTITGVPCIIYYDSQVPKSDFLSQKTSGILEQYKFSGKVVVSEAVDQILYSQKDHIICTSDSVIIDRCSTLVFDLPHYVLKHHFQPDFIDLKDFF